jgi:hypothetical protein
VGGINVRSYLRLLGLGILVAVATGCESTRWNWLDHDSANKTPPAKPGAGISAASLVNYLNDNAGRVHSMKVDDLAIDAKIENQTFGLRGRIFAEKPRNFRMKVEVLGKQEVDIGSNLEEFWFWAAKNPDPRQFYCTYKDLNDGRVRAMPLPIQPEWVMETMGLGPYGPAEKYQMDYQDPKTLRLIERTKSPQGQAVRKVIVMQRQPVRSPQPQVTQYLLLDDTTGQEICSALITSTTIDKSTGAILPYKMKLRMPTQKMEMDLKMDGLSVNVPIGIAVFQRQPMTGVQPFNLGAGLAETGFQRAQGIK